MSDEMTPELEELKKGLMKAAPEEFRQSLSKQAESERTRRNKKN
jgi:hypothetical protein